MAAFKVEDMALTYTGEWSHRTVPGGSMESRHCADGTANPGASASWSGCLTGFDLYGKLGKSGMADIYVDGIHHGSTGGPDEDEEEDEDTQQASLLYSISGLPAGFHTVEIRSAKGRISLDYGLAEFANPRQSRYGSVVCIGDSITFGANVSVRPGHLFGRRLQEMLYVPVSIHGLSGAGIGLISDVLEAVVAPRNPDLVIWLAGMNNPNPQAPFEAGLDKLMTCAPGADIIAATIPYNEYYTPEQNRIKVREVQAACRAKDIPCVDLYTPTRGNRYLNQPENTVHPNDEGHLLIASLFYKAIMQRVRDTSV